MGVHSLSHGLTTPRHPTMPGISWETVTQDISLPYTLTDVLCPPGVCVLDRQLGVSRQRGAVNAAGRSLDWPETAAHQ